MRSLWLLALSALFFELATPGTATTTCDLSGLCFESINAHFGDDDVRIGFAFPPIQNGHPSQEFLASVTFPLPYGFTAFSMDGTDAQLSMALFNFSEEQDDAPLMLDGFVVQMSQTLRNNTLAPIGTAVTSISALSSMTSTSATIIFRCQDCADILSIFTSADTMIPLIVTLSDHFPQYLDNVTHKAMLPLRGSEKLKASFDVRKARAENYGEMLRRAGFET